MPLITGYGQGYFCTAPQHSNPLARHTGAGLRAAGRVPVRGGFGDWVQDVLALTDGQSARGSHDRGWVPGILHLVSAWAQANHLVLA